MSEIEEKLLDIQSKLKAPKGQYNNFGKFYYRNCEDILEAVKPLLKEAGLLLTLTDEVLQVGGDRYYIVARAVVSDGKEKVIATAFAREAASKKGMDEAQITGAASSYARKYALNGLFLIDDTRDPDSDGDKAKDPAQQVKDTFPGTEEVTDKPISKDQRKAITDALKVAGKKIADLDTDLTLNAAIKAESLDELTQGEYDRVKKYVEGMNNA